MTDIEGKTHLCPTGRNIKVRARTNTSKSTTHVLSKGVTLPNKTTVDAACSPDDQNLHTDCTTVSSLSVCLIVVV